MVLAVQGENICRVENRMTLLQMPEMMDYPARRTGLGGRGRTKEQVLKQKNVKENKIHPSFQFSQQPVMYLSFPCSKLLYIKSVQ